MRSNRWVPLAPAAVLGAGLVALAHPTAPGQAPAPGPVAAWEYKEAFGNLRQSNEDLLNEQGAVGWELVAVGDDPRNLVRYTFKRPKKK